MRRTGIRTKTQREKRSSLVCDRFKENSNSKIEEVVTNVFEVQYDMKKDIEEERVLLLRSEQSFHAKRRPTCDKRRDVIKTIPFFWKNVFLNHPLLRGFVTFPFDEKIFESLISLEVGKHTEDKDGYSILFEFSPNDYIKNISIAKNFAIYKRETIITVTDNKIQWAAAVEKWKREKSFFSWFDDTEPLCASSTKTRDQFAEAIKNEIWKDPGRYYYHEKKKDDSPLIMDTGLPLVEASKEGKEAEDKMKQTENQIDEEKDVSSPIMDTDLPLVEASEEGKAAEETMKKIQGQIDEIYKQERTSKETIEQDFTRKLARRCDQRKKLLEKLPQFWYKAFMAHPILSGLLNVTDEKIFRESLISIEVDYKPVAASGYSIIFTFKENEYFYNELLQKDFTLHEGVTTAVKSTVVNWKNGEPVPNKIEDKGDRVPNKRVKDKGEPDKYKKQATTAHSFFKWFHTSSNEEELKRDEVTGHIVNQLWIDPFKHLQVEDGDDTEDTEDEDDKVPKRGRLQVKEG